MTINRTTVADWCEEHLSSHTNFDSEVLDDLTTLGFTLTRGEDRYGVKVDIALDGKSRFIRLGTWEDDFQTLLNRGMGLIVLKPDAEKDVEYFYAGTGRRVTTFDVEGNPKVGKPIYTVLKADEPPALWFGSWVRDTPETREILTFDPLDLVGQLAMLINGEDAGRACGGRGSTFRGSLKSIRG